MAVLTKHLWTRVKQKYIANIYWVKAHAGNPGNTFADKLANDGRLGLKPSGGSRVPLVDWDFDGYKAKVLLLKLDLTHLPSIGSGSRRYNRGSVRTASACLNSRQPHEITITDFTKAIVNSAKSNGKGRKVFSAKVPEEDPVQAKVTSLTADRRPRPSASPRRDARRAVAQNETYGAREVCVWRGSSGGDLGRVRGQIALGHGSCCCCCGTCRSSARS